MSQSWHPWGASVKPRATRLPARRVTSAGLDWCAGNVMPQSGCRRRWRQIAGGCWRAGNLCARKPVVGTVFLL